MIQSGIFIRPYHVGWGRLEAYVEVCGWGPGSAGRDGFLGVSSVVWHVSSVVSSSRALYTP